MTARPHNDAHGATNLPQCVEHMDLVIHGSFIEIHEDEKAPIFRVQMLQLGNKNPLLVIGMGIHDFNHKIGLGQHHVEVTLAYHFHCDVLVGAHTGSKIDLPLTSLAKFGDHAHFKLQLRELIEVR